MIRVMVVANYVEVREGLSMVLCLAGGIEAAGAASSLAEAMRLACEIRPDAVLVDLEMPGGEGYDTIRELARQFPGAAVIALTSHDYPSARASALQAGADRVMVKGMDVTMMQMEIQQAVVTAAAAAAAAAATAAIAAAARRKESQR